MKFLGGPAFFLLCVGLCALMFLTCTWALGACKSAKCSDECFPWPRWCQKQADGKIIFWKFSSNTDPTKAANTPFQWCTNGNVIGGTPCLLDILARDNYDDCYFDCNLDATTPGSTGAQAGNKTKSGSGAYNTDCKKPPPPSP